MNKEKIKTENSEQSKKVIVAMSGGVDSSVAAALLKKQGYFVIGVFMKFWKEDNPPAGGSENRCCSIESENLARLVAKKINIPFYVINAEKEFKKKVVDYFLKEYKKGNTPNPCVVCNKEIKFGFLIDKALKMGVDYIATGHYAKISLAPLSGARLFKAKDKNKDQSYFLWQLNQKQLSRVFFPLSNFTKPEVRVLAKKLKLPTAKTKESQEVCFAQSSNEFLKKYLKEKPGKIIEVAETRSPPNSGERVSAKTLGKHQGLYFYTIGQRKRIGLSGGPYFVIAKDFKNNNLIVSKNQKDLESKEVFLNSINWILPQKLPVNAEIKIRYKSNLAKAKIYKIKNSKIKIVFQKPQKAITPGQSAVFYKEEELLGGGIIEKGL